MRKAVKDPNLLGYTLSKAKTVLLSAPPIFIPDEQLMDHLGRFHHGCVREVHVETEHFVGEGLSMTCGWRTTVHLLVQRQRSTPSAI